MTIYIITVMNALTNAPRRRTQLTSLATTIGWERSRLSHHLQRMSRPRLPRPGPFRDRRAGHRRSAHRRGLAGFRSAAPRHAAWVKQLFFSDLNGDQVNAFADS